MTYNELVEKARELGVAIQDTDEFTAFIVAKTAADKSEKLQDKLGQFNLKKLDLNRAIIAEEKDNEKIAELNGEVKNLYEAIVSDPLMIAYSTTKDELDNTVRFIMQNVVATGVLALVIVFQPELRRMLEHVAQTKLNKLNIFQSSQDKDSELTGVWNESISVIANACETLSKTKTGALIVFERQTKLGEIIKTGTVVDATPSKELIGNLFFVNSPLHDGAMIIRDGRICASGCFLPLSQNYTISKEMGTRHRAALGVSENSDAVVVVVSEETGTISIAEGGVIERNFTIPQLEKRLRHEILHKNEEGQRKQSSVKALLRKVKK